MKRIISFILIAVLCLGVFTGCKLGGDDPQVEQPSGPSLEDAASYLHEIYKSKKEVTNADFDVVAQVSINGVVFPVTWTSDNEKVVIRESTKTGFYTVDLPDANAEEFTYTLTATISDANGNSTTKAYTFKVPVVDNSGITSEPTEGVAYKLFLLQANLGKRFYALNTTQDNANKFINTTDDPKAGVEFFVEKVDGGYKVYTLVDGVKNYIFAKVERTENEDGTVKYSKYIGYSTEEGSVLTYNANMGGVWTVSVLDIVWGVGTYSSYQTICISEGTYFTSEKVGDSQFVMQFMTAEYANTLEADKVETTDDAEAILNQLYALEDGKSAAGEFTLTGKIIALDNYGNPTIVVEGYEDKPVYCYRLSDDRFVVDAVITVTASQMKNYGGTYEFMSCTLKSITLPGGEDPVDPVVPSVSVVDPVVDTAYKFGMVQQNVGTDVYYLAGGMDGYYMATTTDASAAIDVYLEATENGYYLYTLDGESKLYINMVVSGTHVNGAYEATASTVYTYNTESKTIIANVTPEGGEAADYWFGTRNDKSYTTVGPCAISYAGFYCQFYAVEESEGGEDSGENGGNEGGETHTCADADNNFVCDTADCGKVVAPAADSVLTVEQALALGALFTKDTYTADKYYVTGTITEVYNTKYGNMYITDGTNTLCVYGSYDATGANRYDAATPKWVAGDNITVYGIIGAYNDPQMKNGWVTVNTHNHAYSDATCAAPATCPCGATEGEALAHTWADATCTAPKTCSVCGAKDGEANGHNYVEGICSVCGAAQPVAGEETTVTVSIADYADTNSWANSTLYDSITLDSNITVTTSGTAVGDYGLNTGKYYSSNSTWRIYQNETPSVTITAAEGKTIVSVKITYAVKNTGTLTLDGEAVASDTVVEVNANSVTFSVGNTGDATNGQAQITAIEVVYQ